MSFLLRFRGYYPVGDDVRENSYSIENRDLLPCEVQKIIYEENGFYRGLEFPFLISEFEKEINRIFDHQIYSGSLIDEKFKTKYMEIYKSRREFWEGPGGFREDQLSPFGRCKTIEDVKRQLEDADYNKFLFEQLIKDCSIYLGQKSVPVSNYYAQRFNFLNDFINMSFKTENVDIELIDKFYYSDDKKEMLKLKLETINEFEKVILNSKTVNIKSIFKKLLNIDISDVIGIRIEADKKPLITKFDAYKHVYYNLVISYPELIKYIENKENWNKIAYTMTVYPTDKCLDALNAIQIPQEVIEIVMSKNCLAKFEQRYHSYSQKALLKFIDLMETNLLNSSTIEKKFSDEINSDVLLDKVNNYFTNTKLNMSTKYIDNLVASPQVKKTLRKSIITFNQIKDLYSEKNGYKIEYIVVESNKELLNSKKINEYTNNMVGNTNKRKAVAKLYNNDETKMVKHMLLDETNFKCVYCETNLTIDNMEIEHIIPFSISADDSFANKTASCHKCNHDKGNDSPYKYLLKKGEFEQFKSRVEKLKISSEKLSNLLNIADINKYEKKFINRNLRDTSYATKEFMNQLRIYSEALKHKGIEEHFKLVSMPPKITGLIRKQSPKDREAKYHHAFDASIAAYYPLTGLGKISVMINNDMDAFWRTPSLRNKLSNINELKIANSYFEKQLAEMDYSNTKFHREISKNYNGQLANADINKLLIKDDGYKKVEYESSIYEIDDKKLANYFGDNSPLCMRYNDQKTFNFLAKIYNEYKNLEYKNDEGKKVAINPFVHYCIDNHDLTSISEFVVTKHGIRPLNKLNRPIIKRVNYTKNVNMPYVFNKKTINKKDSTNLMLDSLSIAYTKVYKEIKTDKFVFLPIYSVCLDLKTGKVNKNHPYFKYVYKDIIGEKEVSEYLDNSNPMILRSNDYVKFSKKNGEIIEGLVRGYDKSSKRMEIKPAYLYKSKPCLTPSVCNLDKIHIYGLGAINLNIE